MSYDRKAEMEAVLESDPSRLGETFRWDREGLTLEEQADRGGVSTANYGYNNRAVIRALVDGEIPGSPTRALAAARRVRTILKRDDITFELRRDLTDLRAQLMLRAEDPVAQEEENAEAIKATASAEASGTPGIYVYTLPHYLKYPVDPETGKTLLKVGHSATDAYYRAGSQGRLTALPEDPVLLRIYPAEQSAEVEKKFHEWLRLADHNAARTRRGGNEWFLTSTKFLDHIAASLDLSVRVIVDSEVGDE